MPSIFTVQTPNLSALWFCLRPCIGASAVSLHSIFFFVRFTQPALLSPSLLPASAGADSGRGAPGAPVAAWQYWLLEPRRVLSVSSAEHQRKRIPVSESTITVGVSAERRPYTTRTCPMHTVQRRGSGRLARFPTLPGHHRNTLPTVTRCGRDQSRLRGA